MPTKYQAQVTMISKTKTSAVRRDAEVLGPPAEAFAPRIRPTPLRPVWTSNAASPAAPPVAGPQESLLLTAGPAKSWPYAAAKRCFDLIVGSLLLLIATPVILIAALCIRLETKGSPFFVQTRLGKQGKPFKIVKLRGMFIDARSRFASYYDYSKHRDLEFCFHHEEDPRVTRAGRFIRRTSIDELPNLLNVVLGDMSLVGPRPEIPEVLALYGPYRDAYLAVKPGVSCLSKCTGRDRLTKKETIEFDLDYIRRRGFWLDLKILLETFRAVVLRRDVF